jgi:hypothetical protein
LSFKWATEIFTGRLPPLVRHTFRGLFAQYGLVEVSVHRRDGLEAVLFANDAAALLLFLELMEGYVDLRFGPATALVKDAPVGVDITQMSGMGILLAEDGLELPYGREWLYKRNGLVTALSMLADGVQRHQDIVFGEKKTFLTLRESLKEFGELIGKHDLRRSVVQGAPTLERVVLENDRRVVVFELDAAGKTDVKFGDRDAVLDAGGGAMLDEARLTSLREVLESEGVAVSSAPEDASAEDSYRASLKALVNGWERHEMLVFGTTEAE